MVKEAKKNGIILNNYYSATKFETIRIPSETFNNLKCFKLLLLKATEMQRKNSLPQLDFKSKLENMISNVIVKSPLCACTRYTYVYNIQTNCPKRIRNMYLYIAIFLFFPFPFPFSLPLSVRVCIYGIYNSKTNISCLFVRWNSNQCL